MESIKGKTFALSIQIVKVFPYTPGSITDYFYLMPGSVTVC